MLTILSTNLSNQSDMSTWTSKFAQMFRYLNQQCLFIDQLCVLPTSSYFVFEYRMTSSSHHELDPVNAEKGGGRYAGSIYVLRYNIFSPSPVSEVIFIILERLPLTRKLLSRFDPVSRKAISSKCPVPPSHPLRID